LISCYFRFPWRVDPHGLSCFPLETFAPTPVRLSTRATLPATLTVTPPGGTSGVCCATDGGATIRVSANLVNASVTI
jgi:hypothetical protein